MIRIVLPAAMLIFIAHPALTANTISFYNSEYGWKIDVPGNFEIDDASAPETIRFIIDSGGEVTIESGLPDEYFWNTEDAWGSMTRIMSFVAEKLQRESIERGETPGGVEYEDMFFRGSSGGAEVEGFIRLYLGPVGIVLSYTDNPWEFSQNINPVKAFADNLYYPDLDEVLGENEYELREFTNRSYGYRVMYPDIFHHDAVWAFVSFYFLGEPVIDVYVDRWEDKSPEEMIAGAKQLVLKEFASYDYTIFDETGGSIDGGYKYLDFKLDDGEADRWIKRVRIFALAGTTVRFQYYCPDETLPEHDKAFEIIVESFEYNPAWITETSEGPETPLDELYESGDFDWVDYRNGEYNYRISIPDFLEIETRDGFVFFNYGYKTVITIKAEPAYDRDPDESLKAAERAAVDEFGARWPYTRYGDVSGTTDDGWPYIDFKLDDNDPDAPYVRRVRIIGAAGIAFRIEMYESRAEIDNLAPLFNDIANSFTYEINLLTG